MKKWFNVVRTHSGLIMLPLWAALLVLPLAGVFDALKTAAVAALAVVLFRFRKKITLPYFHGLAQHADRMRSAAKSLSPFFASRSALAVFLACLIVIPLGLNDYYLDILTLTGMYIVLALGLNIIVGQAGLLNLGYVAFYAVGAYAYAILSTRFGLAFWPGLAVGAGTAALFAYLLGLATLGLRGDYFAIVTLGLGEITRIVLNNGGSVTGGPNGISQIGRPVIAGYAFSGVLDFYYLILVIAAFTVFVMQRLMNSRIGRAWIAIREDEIAAEAMGVNAFRYKLLAFVLGSAWAGMAGVYFASKMAFVSPESFNFFESVIILCMVVLGGMNSIPGIMLGAFFLIALPEMFRDFQDYRMLAFGIALVLMMIFRPQGLLGARRK